MSPHFVHVILSDGPINSPCCFEFVSPCRGPLYLGLRQAQLGCQVGPLGQRQVLGLLEALVKRLQLQAGVNGPRLPYLLPLPVQPHLPVLNHCSGLLKLCRTGRERLVLR